MDKFVISGGKKLSGSVKISGSKNSSLALMPAAILGSGKSILKNTPELNDVFTMSKLLKHLGAEINFKDEVLEIDSSGINEFSAPYEHVKKMRASVYVLGPLLAKFGNAKVSLPGGCAWGPRPVNLHIEAMKKLGADIDFKDGYIIAEAKKLKGAKINFDVSSVGATGNALMAATLAKGTTLINNAAIEPEITQLAEFLSKMGARINGIGTNSIEIEGVAELNSAEITTIPDRIESGTLLTAAAITNSEITLKETSSEYLEAVLLKLEDAGCKISRDKNQVNINAKDFELKPVSVTTSIFPGFPTDMQAQWTALMSVVNGVSRVTDTIYFDRFKHVPELNRLGAQIVTGSKYSFDYRSKKIKGCKSYVNRSSGKCKFGFGRFNC